jgi:hypothetical protein
LVIALLFFRLWLVCSALGIVWLASILLATIFIRHADPEQLKEVLCRPSADELRPPGEHAGDRPQP